MTEEKKEIPVFEKKQDSIEKILDDFEQLYQEEICASNNLLGKFVGGKYIIPREIKEDLVKHKKILTSQEDDKVYCVLRHELDVFHLTLFIEDYGEEKQIAKLYLVEKIKEEDFDLRSFIAEFISDRRPDFMFKSQIVFNIILTEESKGLDEDEDEFADMKHIQEKLLENKKQHEEDLEFMTEMYSETYVKKMIEELKKMGPKGEKILKEFKEKVEKQKTEEKVSSKVYTKLKKQLDVIIKKNGGLKELVKQNPNITKVVKEYTEPIKAYKQLMKKDIVLGKQEKPVDKSSEKKAPAKKPAAKKASSSKSGGKKSGGAKPKKEEKKKDAKKKDKKKDEKKKIYGEIKKKKDDKKDEKKAPQVAKQKIEPKTKSSKIPSPPKTLTPQPKPQATIEPKAGYEDIIGDLGDLEAALNSFKKELETRYDPEMGIESMRISEEALGREIESMHASEEALGSGVESMSVYDDSLGSDIERVRAFGAPPAIDALYGHKKEIDKEGKEKT